MKILKKPVVILGIILLLAAFLRLYQLGNVPPSPDWDEVALGYSAYSILHTGRDEFGKFLPVVLRSFDDYKPALYAYLIIPFIQLFGLSVSVVRLPSAIIGILTILVVYLLLKELFKREDIPLLSSFLLAISPWHIQFSRIAFESNVGLFFNICTALFFIKGLKKPWYLSLSAVSAALALYAYQSEKVFTPLFVLLLISIFYKKLFDINWKYLVLATVIGIIFAAPMLSYIITNKEALTRATSTLAFSDVNNYLKVNAQRLIDDKNSHDLVGLLVDNRRILYLKTVLSGYLSHFDLNWLFITGDIPRHHAPFMGLLYIWELPFLLSGIYLLIFSKEFDKKSKLLLLFWFLLAPVPASVTSGVPHAVRTLNFLPTFQVFTAIGIIYGLLFGKKHIRNSVLQKVVFSIVIGIALFNFIYYMNQYFVQQNKFFATDWQYGYAPAIKELMKIKKNYEKIIVSDKEPMDQSYMFFLFYLQYPPDIYQKKGNKLSGGFAVHHTFDKYEFRTFNWTKKDKNEHDLFIGTPADFTTDANVIQTIPYPNGKPAILFVE